MGFGLEISGNKFHFVLGGSERFCWRGLNPVGKGGWQDGISWCERKAHTVDPALCLATLAPNNSFPSLPL